MARRIISTTPPRVATRPAGGFHEELAAATSWWARERTHSEQSLVRMTETVTRFASRLTAEGGALLRWRHPGAGGWLRAGATSGRVGSGGPHAARAADRAAGAVPGAARDRTRRRGPDPGPGAPASRPPGRQAAHERRSDAVPGECPGEQPAHCVDAGHGVGAGRGDSGQCGDHRRACHGPGRRPRAALGDPAGHSARAGSTGEADRLGLAGPGQAGAGARLAQPGPRDTPGLRRRRTGRRREGTGQRLQRAARRPGRCRAGR